MIKSPAAGHEPWVGRSSAVQTEPPSAVPSRASPRDHSSDDASSLDAASVKEADTEAERSTVRDRSRAVVLEHVDFVWRLLRRLGVPSAEVDDATQQVLIIALKRLDAISLGSERAFLSGTAVRVASSFRRSAFRRQRKLGDWRLEVPTATTMPDDEVERRQALALLDEALAGLPDELRRVFVLCEIEEMSAREVAALEGLRPGTVASRLRRAREAFEARLRELCATERTTP